MLFHYPLSRPHHVARPWNAFGPVWKDENHSYVLTMPALGLDAQDVSLEVKDNVLSLSFATEHTSQQQFARSAGKLAWRIPSDVDADSIAASLSKGILTVTLPRRPQQEGRKILVQDTEGAVKNIEGMQ